jgi:hypothetical protein
MSEEQINTLYVDFEHLHAWDQTLAQTIQSQYFR